MQPHPSPSAHACTPPVAVAPQPVDCYTLWNALSFDQRREMARDQLLAMLANTKLTGIEVLALAYAAATLTVAIEERNKLQGGTA